MSVAVANDLEAHAQALTVGSSAWNQLKKEVAEHRLTEAEFRERLKVASPLAGISAKPGSNAPSPAAAGQNIKKGKNGESLGETLLHIAEGPLGPGTEFEQEVNKINPATIASEAASGAVSKVFGWVEEAFGQELVKGLLYVALAGGGAVLLVSGVSRAAGLHPAQAARKAAMAGALA